MKANLNKVSLKETIKQEREKGITSGMCTALAAVCYIKYKIGWHKEDINKLIDDVISLLDMPPIFGKSMDNSDVILYLQDKGIDVMRVQEHIKVDWS